jgi:AmmeMemoRadiSam system protein B/AmmeMemoRadiSam system protein A
MSIGEAVRPAAVAGRFYPGSAGSLADFITRHMHAATLAGGKGEVSGMIVPHAGYSYSGEVAALCFSMIDDARINRVIVMGPSHYKAFRGISVPTYAAYRTPLGLVDVDRESCASLRAAHPVFTFNPASHEQEHSVEVELPFLQMQLTGFQLIPLVYGQLTRSEIDDAAAVLADYWDESTLLVVSSDFTHYGERFGHMPFPVEEAGLRLAQQDRGAIDLICGQDREAFLDYIDDTGATICGRLPIAVMLAMMEHRGETWKVDLEKYTNSGEMLGDYSSSVSYAALTVQRINGLLGDVGATNWRFSAEDRASLLSVAREAIATQLGGTADSSFDCVRDHLYEPGGAFVSLHIGDRLRGCIGNLDASQPLVETVRKNAISAAFKDARFSPLTEEELDEVSIEISCLTPMHRIGSIDEFEVGRHGIVLERAGRRAVFLPQVAPEQGWDAETTLEYLSQKAGLPRAAWSQHGVVLSVFEAVVFGEDD